MYFSFLEKLLVVIKRYRIAPSNISNIDEKGFTYGGTPGKASYAVVLKGHLSTTRIKTGNRK
jgi:RecA-family ATPase